MKGIARNIFFSLLGVIWSSILLIIATPIIVTSLGKSAYGVWALVGNIVGYLSLFNSLQTAGTKYLAEYLAIDDQINVRKLLGTSLVFNLGIGILGGFAIFFSASFPCNLSI